MYLTQMVTNDALWKGIIEDLLEDFLTFFFPDIEFILSRKPVFLDQELEEIYPVKELILEKINIIRELMKRKVDPKKIRSLISYIRSLTLFYTTFPST